MLRPAPVPDEERFEDLFRGYYGRARGLARRRFPQLDAEEIAQEAMLRVLTHVDSIDGRRDPWPYIATITMNVGRDMTRSLRPTLELDQHHVDAPLAPAADEELLMAEVDEGLRSVLGRLTPAGRQILTLHAYGDMSIGQIAAFLGCNDNAVRQKLFRARRQFVRVLDEVLAASAAVLGVVGWMLRRPASRGSSRVVVSASAMTLSGAVFAVLGVATVHLVTATGAQPAPATTAAAMSRASVPVVSPVRRVATARAAHPDAVDTPAAATTVGPAEITASQPGSFLKPGHTNHEHITMHTAAGDVRLGNDGRNDNPAGGICKTGLVACR